MSSTQSSSPIRFRGRFARARSILRALLLAIIGLLVESSAYGAPVYEITDLGILPGSVSSTATSVDSSGEVVGYSTFGDGHTEAFYWTVGGGMVGLGGTNSKAFGVSNGNVVGISGNQAFRWTSGPGMVLIDAANQGQANGVNAGGEAIGTRKSGASTRVLTWSPSNSISNPFSLANLTGTAINDLGQFVGLNNTTVGYFYDGSIRSNIAILPNALSNNQIAAGSASGVAAYENLNTLSVTPVGTLPGDLVSNLLGINPSGTQIVGTSDTIHAIYFDIATSSLSSVNSLLALDANQWNIYDARSISDTGLIAGDGSFSGGATHAI
ncbi:MAG TPA: hypothetical protein VGJ26_10085, partial [Pirellulales bacterium]